MRAFWFATLAGISLACSAPAGAQMLPTIYSDGLSCPNNCDSHVVFHKSRNGTAFASLPASPRSAPQPCRTGEPCRICFSAADSSCLVVTYRGGGPPENKFDFTPAFYQEFCPKPDLPAPLRTQCTSFGKNLAKLTSDKVYCLAQPTHSGCAQVIAAAEAKKAADQPLFDECRQLGEKKFNKQQEKKKQRSEGCAYEKVGTGGPNKKGVTWRRLLPALCQQGAFVGRDGLDCCDSNLMALGGLGSECTPFLVAK